MILGCVAGALLVRPISGISCTGTQVGGPWKCSWLLSYRHTGEQALDVCRKAVPHTLRQSCERDVGVVQRAMDALSQGGRGAAVPGVAVAYHY